MSPDKDTLQVQLQRLTSDWIQLQIMLTRCKQQIQQFHEQIAQKSAAIECLNRAAADNQILSKAIADQMGKAEMAAILAQSSPDSSAHR